MSKKVSTEDFIKKAKAVHGEKYDYSKSKYVAARTMITVTCKLHGDFELVPYSHYAGSGCNECGKLSRGDKTRLTVDQIKAKIKAVHGEKYIYKSLDFKNVEERITVTCKEHGEFTQRVMNHLRGDGCMKCSIDIAADSRRRSFWEFVVAAKAVHGETYIYPEQVYKGSLERVKIVCPDHGEFEQIADNHLANHGCPTCGKAYAGEKRRVGIEELMKRILETHGNTYEYAPLPEYSLYDEPITVICKEHGEFIQRINVHLMGSGCTKCACGSHSSKIEDQLFEFVSSLDSSAIRHERILNGKEIDIYLPEKKIGIELHGLYWHKGEKGKVHVEKHDLAVSKGIRLIQIFEDEWCLKPNVVMHTLSMLFGKLHSVGARQTTAKALEYSEAKKFLDAYHLQGSHFGSDYIGLYLRDELVSVAVFGHSRFNKGDLELIRYATKYSVVGGLSKLIKHFSLTNKDKTLHSYSDLRWFVGSAYEHSGFKSNGRTQPGYFWCKRLNRISRFKFQKRKIKAIIPEADLSQTEDQIATNAGYFKLYDCGHSKWSKVL